MGFNWRSTLKKKDEDREKDFIEWLKSIGHVDKNGNVKPVVLKKDDSSDPENDRAGV